MCNEHHEHCVYVPPSLLSQSLLQVLTGRAHIEDYTEPSAGLHFTTSSAFIHTPNTPNCDRIVVPPR